MKKRTFMGLAGRALRVWAGTVWERRDVGREETAVVAARAERNWRRVGFMRGLLLPEEDVTAREEEIPRSG
jgi:hypothetical protein